MARVTPLVLRHGRPRPFDERHPTGVSMSSPSRTARHERLVAIALVALSAAGCTHAVRSDDRAWATPGRMLVDAPARFVTTDANDIDGAPASGCAPRLVDRRYGVELQLVRSSASHDAQWRGDYRASAPARYDVADGELLRVECATGLPLGVVSGSALAVEPPRASPMPRDVPVH
jgi:hypothetical protein